ncbi:hypothetical protein ANRL4_01206 [Anaerolineae bacterium]|nr:hypothetical protein ANRL4_01206 [Anaerolineae bacterium]
MIFGNLRALGDEVEVRIPSEQIAFLIGLQQMIRENAEYGGFTVGEVPVSGIDPVMHALARLKYFLDHVEARAQADPIFAANLGLQKGASELDAGDLASLAGGIFGLSKFGKDVPQHCFSPKPAAASPPESTPDRAKRCGGPAAPDPLQFG